MKKAFMFVVAAVLIISCSTTNVLKKSATYSFKSEPINVKYNVTLGKEIRGEATISRFLLITVPFTRTVADNIFYAEQENNNSLNMILKPFKDLLGAGGIAELAKATAAYNACKDGNFDVIIAPVYEVTVSDYFVFKTVTAKVRGRGAYLTDILVENQIPTRELNLMNIPQQQPSSSAPTAIIPSLAPVKPTVAPSKKPDRNKSYFLMLNNQKYGPVSVKQIEDLKSMGYCNNDSIIIDPNTNTNYKVGDL